MSLNDILFKSLSLFFQTHKICLVGFGIVAFVLLAEMGAQQTMVSKEDALPGRDQVGYLLSRPFV